MELLRKSHFHCSLNNEQQGWSAPTHSNPLFPTHTHWSAEKEVIYSTQVNQTPTLPPSLELNLYGQTKHSRSRFSSKNEIIPQTHQTRRGKSVLISFKPQVPVFYKVSSGHSLLGVCLHKPTYSPHSPNFFLFLVTYN